MSYTGCGLNVDCPMFPANAIKQTTCIRFTRNGTIAGNPPAAVSVANCVTIVAGRERHTAQATATTGRWNRQTIRRVDRLQLPMCVESSSLRLSVQGRFGSRQPDHLPKEGSWNRDGLTYVTSRMDFCPLSACLDTLDEAFRMPNWRVWIRIEYGIRR